MFTKYTPYKTIQLCNEKICKNTIKIKRKPKNICIKSAEKNET